MTKELVAKVAATVAAYFGEHDTPEDVARAIIPIVRADALEEVSRHLSAVQYDPAPYTALKYRLASLAKG